MSLPKLYAGLALGALTLVPRLAFAGNGLHPRTPVLWNDTACFEVVDRSVDPIYEVHYDIPHEDTDVTEDEVVDSRRHQFFGICRQFHAQRFLPIWIAWADVDAAVAKNLVDLNAVDDENVFETSSAWNGCWFRINADDERRPITDEMAGEPVPWDASDVPVGTYVLWGYTYEPALNRWWQRKGSIVKVIDGGDPAEIGPGAAITTREQTPYKGETVAIDGCVDALPGSTMTGYFESTAGSHSPDWEPEWTPFAQDIPVEGESFTLDFDAPEDLAGETLMIRVDVTDPMDRTYEAHMPENVIVLKGMDTDCETGGGNFIGGAGCGDESGGSTGDGPGTTTTGGSDVEPTGTTAGSDSDGGQTGDPTTGGADGGDGEPESCVCTAGTTPTPWHLALLLLGLGAIRRRSHATR